MVDRWSSLDGAVQTLILLPAVLVLYVGAFLVGVGSVLNQAGPSLEARRARVRARKRRQAAGYVAGYLASAAVVFWVAYRVGLVADLGDAVMGG